MPPPAEPTPLEAACLAAFRNGGTTPSFEDHVDGWTAWGLGTLLEACRMLRAGQHATAAGEITWKADGSPSTPIEGDVEMMLRDRLTAFRPGAVVVGEETGGELAARGCTVAVDPVDGTWAFLNGMETYTTTLAVFEDGRPVMGFVANPTTGDIAYAGPGRPARLLQVSAFGEPDSSVALPFPHNREGPVLVNVHPNRRASAVVSVLYDAWGRDAVRIVRSTGGSPAWAMLEAAKGRFVYVNVWSRRPAEPFDLAAPALILRAAGGEIVDLHGRPADVLTHAGPFVASVDHAARRRVTRLVHEALDGS